MLVGADIEAVRPKCPHPWKKAHPSRAHAKKEHASKVRRRGGDHVRPYPCECGSWHVGHLPTETMRGLKTANEVYERQRRRAS